ncbi:MAG TPA: TIGR00730 family Rossman fold protein [candidate division Zixibacteria bacterium]|nr:TIGR00730 family Rossman fold protein [candidate division Zixibacteria bacterium]
MSRKPKKPTEKELRQMTERLKKSKAYRVAYKDLEFMDLGIARPYRLQLELMKPEVLLRRNRIRSTIVVFGGTRIIEPAKAKARVESLRKKLDRKPNDKELKRQLRVARSILRKSHYYDEALEFGRLVSTDCADFDGHEFVITTGGGPGIMEAANRGAYEEGASSIGMNITLPMEQEPNPYISPELCFNFHYFAIRKMHFLLRARALVAFPGGFGTMDELFEALTLVQTFKVRPLPIVLFGEAFWRKLINFDFLVDEGTIAPEDRELFVYADKAIDAWNYIKYFYSTPNARGTVDLFTEESSTI